MIINEEQDARRSLEGFAKAGAIAKSAAFFGSGKLCYTARMSVFFTGSGNAISAAQPAEAILADIARVARLTQPVIRNLWIPPELQQLLCEEAKLHERLSGLLAKLPGAWAEQIDPLAVPRAVLGRVSEQIALGNLKVFAELAPLFAQFWDRFRDPARLTEAELDAQDRALFLPPFSAEQLAILARDQLPSGAL